MYLYMQKHFIYSVENWTFLAFFYLAMISIDQVFKYSIYNYKYKKIMQTGNLLEIV